MVVVDPDLVVNRLGPRHDPSDWRGDDVVIGG